MFEFPPPPEASRITYKHGTEEETDESWERYLRWSGALSEWNKIKHAYSEYLRKNIEAEVHDNGKSYLIDVARQQNDDYFIGAGI